MRIHWLRACILTVGLVFTATATMAQNMSAGMADTSQTQSPAAFIENLAQVALNSLAGKPLSDEETQARFRTLLRQSFDLKTIGRYVLGNYFKSATPQQREDYQQAFENMIVDAYAFRFRDYTGGTIKTGKVTQQGTDSLVESQILETNGAPPINVTWKIRPEPDGYKIIDVAVEGISMGTTEREEFSSYIERNGGDVQVLIDAMKQHKVGLNDETQQ